MNFAQEGVFKTVTEKMKKKKKVFCFTNYVISYWRGESPKKQTINSDV